MVKGKIILRNYRCFDWDNPAILEFGDGFSAYVGANNSGKSSALRSIYELRTLFQQLWSLLIPASGQRLNFNPQGIADVPEIANENDPTRVQVDIELDDSLRPSGTDHMVAFKIRIVYDVRQQACFLEQFAAMNVHGNEAHFDRPQLAQLSIPSTPSLRIEILGVRTDFTDLVEFATAIGQSKYFPAFRNAINEGAGRYYDLPIGTALIDTWDFWKAGSSKDQKRAISRVEMEIASLLGFGRLEINADKSGKSLDVIIDGRPQKLHEVGAGVAQLIIVLAAALVEKPPFILIDEPELSLHPSLQLSFLVTLASYAKIGLLYATHSIALARSSTSRIYAVKRIRNGRSEMHPYNDVSINYAGWLGELSYSSRVELGCEGLILVEGPTEVLCFQELLRKVGKDAKYVLMSLGGASLIRGGVAMHLSEICRLVDAPSKIRVFIDSEKASADAPLASDREEFVHDCMSLGIAVHVSERRATENYFDEQGIRNALGDGFQPLTPYQRLKEAIRPWHKSENWRIVREIEFSAIEHTDLGKFIAELE